MQAPVSISGIDVAIQFFTIKYMINGSVCDSEVIELSGQACVQDPNVCMVGDYNVTSTTSNCTINNESDNVVMIVTATNDLGTGQEAQVTVGKDMHLCI